MPHKYLGLIPQLATGIRLPDIVIPPVLKALKDNNSVGTLMLSYHRETAPKDVIKVGENILLGHTGTSIEEYISKALEYSDLFGALIQIEADHVSMMASPERAIKRITGGEFEYGLTESEIRKSLDYIEREFREAKDAGGVDIITIDTCELINLEVDKLNARDIEPIYEEIERELRRDIEKYFLNRDFKFTIDPGSIFYIKFDREDIMRLVAKYSESIEYVEKILRIASKYIESKFGIEIALDEVPGITPIKDAIFYILELKRRGIKVDFIAPNIGFNKREDLKEDLREFERRLKLIYEVVKSLGAFLSFHSGSGAHPYSDKGPGTWDTIKKVTKGNIKYKVSGIYIQLLLEVMSKFPEGSEPRKVYEEIYSTVLATLETFAAKSSLFYSPTLEKTIERYREVVKANPNKAMDPRADFFRHYFFIFQAVKDDKGFRYLREKVLNLYSKDESLRKRYNKEAYELTSRILNKLGLLNTISRYKIRI